MVATETDFLLGKWWKYLLCMRWVTAVWTEDNWNGSSQIKIKLASKFTRIPTLNFLLSQKCEFDMKECWGQFWISFLFLAAKKWEGGINLHDLDQGQAVEGASAHFFTQILLNFPQFSSNFFTHFLTYRICSWSRPLNAFGPKEERWL